MKKTESKKYKWIRRIGILIALGAVAAGVKERLDLKKNRSSGKAEEETAEEGQEKEAPHTPGFYERNLKRPLDFAISLVGTILLLPVLVGLMILVRIKLGKPVFFRQERPGKDGKVFSLIKFRTMNDARDKAGNLLPDEERLTPFGSMLRSTSLDELPELLNILKGDMALVGPRPLLVRYLPRYNAHQSRRHEVRPGFTGLAQVHGRNAITWEDKFDWDVKYVDNVSLIGDLKILFATVGVVLKKEGISSGTSATMEEFMGTEAKTEADLR